MRVFLRFSFPLLGPFVFPLRLLLSYLLFFSFLPLLSSLINLAVVFIMVEDALSFGSNVKIELDPWMCMIYDCWDHSFSFFFFSFSILFFYAFSRLGSFFAKGLERRNWLDSIQC